MKNKCINGFYILFILYFFSYGCALATSPPLQKIDNISQCPKPAQISASPVTPQAVDFKVCCKIFHFDSQRLFYLTLASINANRFKIDEIQSKSGYILFTAAHKQFLASVVTIDSKTSMLKITPCSNIYFFPIGIVQNMFKYIELNVNTPVEKLNVM